jgi:hypothetical protein
MNITKKILSAILFLVLTSQLSAWGYKAHYVIAEIAERNLTPNAKAKVDDMLKGRKMVYWADWMDKVRSDSTYDFVRTWHFANVDSGYTYETMPKMETGDVVTATELALKMIQSKTENDSVKTMYLKFLIHLIADLHCPVHAGRSTDRGGNLHTLSWFGRPTELHTLWDEQILDAARIWSYSEWADNLIAGTTAADIAQMQRGAPKEWFNETVLITKHIYSVTPKDQNFSFRYVYQNSHIVEQQLTLGGYRLAYVLNSIFK